jgi:hypothetical protein
MVHHWMTWFRLSSFGWSEGMLLPPRNSIITPHDAEVLSMRESIPDWMDV